MLVKILYLVTFFFNGAFSMPTAGYYLFFPKNAILQINLAITSLVESPDLGSRRIAANLGYQIVFGMPNFLYNFTTPFAWPGINKVVHPDLNNQGRVLRDLSRSKNETSFDLTADTFYESLRHLLQLNGFHGSCLEHAVCDINRYPLHVHDDDILSELLQFFLSPSQNSIFSESSELQKYYNQIERLGLEGHDCSKLFPYCKESFLEKFTDLIENIPGLQNYGTENIIK